MFNGYCNPLVPTYNLNLFPPKKHSLHPGVTYIPFYPNSPIFVSTFTLKWTPQAVPNAKCVMGTAIPEPYKTTPPASQINIKMGKCHTQINKYYHKHTYTSIISKHHRTFTPNLPQIPNFYVPTLTLQLTPPGSPKCQMFNEYCNPLVPTYNTHSTPKKHSLHPRVTFIPFYPNSPIFMSLH
jgi:hypothetical protein